MQKLTQKFASIKNILPKGKLTRWLIARDIFSHQEPRNHAANEALTSMKFWGERTKSRWIEEYRHQRKIRSIMEETR